MKKKKTPKSTTPSILDSENWISQSSVAGNLARAQDAPPPNSSDSPDLCNLSFIKKCVGVPWANTQYNAWENLEIGVCQVGDVTWAIEGDPDGTTTTSPGIFTFGGKGAKITISATCMGKKVIMTLVYVKAELLEVEFANAHGKGTKKNIITDEISSHVKNGNLFVPPFRGWKNIGAIDNPVAHTFSDKLTINLKLKITPTGLSFDLTGKGISGQFGDLIWTRFGANSTGNSQDVLNIVPAGDLPQSVGISKGSIQWSIAAKCCSGNAGNITVKTVPDESGPHEIFRTLAQPNPAPSVNATPSIARMRTVCTLAKDKTTDLEIVQALSEKWPDSGTNTAAPPAGNIYWRILDNFRGDCLACGTSFSQACLLLGINAEFRKIFASNNNMCLAIKQKVVQIDGKDKDATLLFATVKGHPGEAGNGPNYNEYQTVGYVFGKYWNVYGTKATKDNSCAMFNFLTDPDEGFFVAQYWVIIPPNEHELNKYLLYSDEPFKILNCNN